MGFMPMFLKYIIWDQFFNSLRPKFFKISNGLIFVGLMPKNLKNIMRQILMGLSSVNGPKSSANGPNFSEPNNR